MNHLPKAKSENIVVQKLKDEVLLYDLTTNRAFCLNDTSAKVFEFCDGETTFEDFKRKHKFTDDLIYLALDALRKENLLIDKYVSPFAGLNRRQVIRKIGLGTMLVFPVIFSLTAPLASHAASITAATAACQPCTQNSQCASGNCAPLALGSGSLCSNGSRNDITFRPGESFEVGEIVCSSLGTGACCAGSATLRFSTRCTCNG